MKSILITGGTGLIGKKLISQLDFDLYNIIVLTRRKSHIKEGIRFMNWDPDNNKLDLSQINDLDTIINLVGESIDKNRWTKKQKLNIYNSRIKNTQLLFSKIKELEILPKHIISASAIAIYKSNTKESQKEDSVLEDDYLARVVKDWEEENIKFKQVLEEKFKSRFDKIRFPNTVGIGIKPISSEGTNRLVRSAIDYAINNKKDSVTLVHKGNIMKYTEGAFRDWCYQLAKKEYGAVDHEGGPWQVISADSHKIIIKDVIADAFLQQILLRPKEYSVIATMNLNGDYISDALAAIVGGIGIAPGANINYETGHAIFEATHGTAPKYAGLDKVNPGSVILSGAMMLEYLGWNEAKDLIYNGLIKSIESGKVTYDFERQMNNATLLSCSQFGEEIVKNM